MSSRSVSSAQLRNPYTVPLVRLLDELSELVTSLSDPQFVQKPVGVVPSSVGAHVRHCLDHVQALLQSLRSGTLDYDRRERGTSVESNRRDAIERIELLACELSHLELAACEKPLQVSLMMTVDGLPVLATSSVGRELAFVLSHTIHHNAIIGAMVKTLGAPLPEQFGYAPSTLASLGQTETACVRSA